MMGVGGSAEESAVRGGIWKEPTASSQLGQHGAVFMGPRGAWRWRHQAKEAARRRAKARGGIVWVRAATPAGVRQEVTGSD